MLNRIRPLRSVTHKFATVKAWPRIGNVAVHEAQDPPGFYNVRFPALPHGNPMPQMMKALVKRNPEQGIWMEEVPVPEVGPNEVLIKLEKTAICGTDLHIYKWDEWSQRTIKPGLTIGHEFVGRIVEIGPGVTGYKIGDRVSAEGHIVCGHCRNCRAGRQHLCPNTIGIGVNRNGAFAEYMTMPASNLWPIPDQIPSELAAFFDPYGNAAHCALEFTWWARTC
jgi:threonine 3-dehydrogenase